ncbi:unnamed protein product [Spirodela intermedia]|uniref:Receptor-like serine/threonine-protein kinase n=1 Tax=Spirodela intermedia TaxID=51605 RepID=A0A7I8KA30_SPIIN|nr:unnamed protein product [Spirodela intermedia]
MGQRFLPYLIWLLISSLYWVFCVADNRLHPDNRIFVNQTITSSGGIFALGFFSPGNSTENRYIGIWYNSIPEKTVVWVANREAPLVDASGVLTVMADGNIALIDGKGVLLWSSNLTGIPVNTSAVLLDSGNFVLRDSEENVLWESFNQPSDTYLPTMDISLNINTGKSIDLTAWKDPQDPSPGNFSFGLDRKSLLQLVVKEGSKILWRSQPWRARQAFVVGNFNTSDTLILSFSFTEKVLSLSSLATGALVLSRYTLDTSGRLNFSFLNPRGNSWSLMSSFPSNACDIYKPCGAFSFCKLEGSAHSCRCLEGFEPTNMKEWEVRNFSRGCLRKVPLRLNKKDEFLRYETMKLPDDFSIWWNRTAEQCMTGCLDDGQCTAYAIANFTGGDRIGSRCLVWSGELIDLVKAPNSGEDLYVRVASAQLDPNGKSTTLLKIVAPTVAVVATLLMGASFFLLFRKRKSRKGRRVKGGKGVLFDGSRSLATLGSEHDMSEPIKLEFSSIMSTTNNFSTKNQLGHGGFGSVYKGKLLSGREVAIKRLSKFSGQGLEEFKNEVKLIAKLQHTNLVRLLGWCDHDDEKLLVYEYMPNGSLDKLIFDERRSAELDWGKRLRIVEGIANGLLYLHQHSRLRVIHRDLKTSNVLLDAQMNPKISDFGLARIFDGTQTEANTGRVLGTYGYMSPEYAMDGVFSEKSDVFSFGVMVLEIVTGKRTTGFYPYKDSFSLVGYVWQMWKEGRSLELVDPAVDNVVLTFEAEKCIRVGLLCVQEDAADRPDMSSVVFMLRKESTALSSPKQPTFGMKKAAVLPSSTVISAMGQEHCNGRQPGDKVFEALGDDRC